MSRLSLLAAGALLAGLAATPVAAQQPASARLSTPDTATRARRDTGSTAARAATEAAADSAVRELGRAMSELATSVQQVIAETANKPELRLAAVQVAGRAVTLAQTTLADSMSDIEKALAEATRVLAEAEAVQKAKVEKP